MIKPFGPQLRYKSFLRTRSFSASTAFSEAVSCDIACHDLVLETERMQSCLILRVFEVLLILAEPAFSLPRLTFVMAVIAPLLILKAM